MKNWTPQDIKKLRKKHKLSRAKFGGLVGVSGNYIYMVEKGVRQAGKPLKLLLSFIESNLKKEDKLNGNN